MIDYSIIRQGKKCIVWTRVSTKYQQDNGGSLESQRECCERYAEQNGYSIVDYCGGKHESAKTPGKMITEMMNKVKRDKSISTILISEFDRFSRKEWQASKMLGELRVLGILVVATKFGMDTRTKEGMMLAQQTLSMAEWDNQNRTDKFVGGRADCIKAGAWCEKAPLGYYKEGKSRSTWCYLNKEGKLIKNAFKWKLEGYSNGEILDKLSARGLDISKQTLHKILVNPFYAGKIVHKYNNMEMIDGQIEPAVNYTDFLKVQDILSGRTGTYMHKKVKPEFPLVRYVYCSADGTPFTSYTKTKKTKETSHQYGYYKCNQIGCGTNVSAELMHDKYEALLSEFEIPQEFVSHFEEMAKEVLLSFSEESKSQNTLLKKRLTDIDNNIKRVKVRFGTDEIDKDTYTTTIAELQDRKDVIMLEMDKWNENLSNLEKQIPVLISTASNISTLWHNSDLETKKQIQNLVFPEGVFWDKEICGYRTPSRNKVFDVLSEYSAIYKKETEAETSTSVPSCG